MALRQFKSILVQLDPAQLFRTGSGPTVQGWTQPNRLGPDPAQLDPAQLFSTGSGPTVQGWIQPNGLGPDPALNLSLIHI